jgi:hypothetical protein
MSREDELVRRADELGEALPGLLERTGLLSIAARPAR